MAQKEISSVLKLTGFSGRQTAVLFLNKRQWRCWEPPDCADTLLSRSSEATGTAVNRRVLRVGMAAVEPSPDRGGAKDCQEAPRNNAHRFGGSKQRIPLRSLFWT